MKKYELTAETKTMPGGEVVYRIRALRSFNTIHEPVEAGDIGGWVQSEANLSHEGNCWIFDDAVGYQNSRRTGNSVGYGYSHQYGYSQQSGASRQYGDSQQSGNSWQFGNSAQYGNSRQYGYSQQSGASRQYGTSQQYGSSRQYGNSQQYGDSQQYGNSRQYGYSLQYGTSQQYGNSHHVTGTDDGYKTLTMGPFGDEHRCITIQPDGTVVADRFHGTVEEFKVRVREKNGADYGAYAICIKMLDAFDERGNNA